MKTALLILLVLPQLSWAAPAGTDSASAKTETKKATVSESGKKTSPSKKDPSAAPCIPQQTHADRVNDLAKLDGTATDTHSTNCPSDGAIKNHPGSKTAPATVPVADPVQVK